MNVFAVDKTHGKPKHSHKMESDCLDFIPNGFIFIQKAFISLEFHQKKINITFNYIINVLLHIKKQPYKETRHFPDDEFYANIHDSVKVKHVKQ